MVGRVLLTGAAGKVARSVRPHVALLCRELRLADIVPFEAAAANEVPVVTDLCDPTVLPGLLDGVEAVVHFAGHPREASWPQLIEANVRAAAQLWEAAVAAGVRRIVYASSNHAVGFYARSRRIDASAAARPDSRYGVTKVFMEALASFHADKHGLRAMGIRIGHCSPEPTDARALAHWVHPQDLAQLIEVGLTADYRHEIVYGVSANSASWWDNRRALELGYQPSYSADLYASELAAKVSTEAVAEIYQGGSFAADGFLGDASRPARVG